MSLQCSQMDEEEATHENLIKISNKSMNHQHTPAGSTIQDQCKAASIQQLISEYKKYVLRKTHSATQVAQIFKNEIIKRYGRLEDQKQEKDARIQKLQEEIAKLEASLEGPIIGGPRSTALMQDNTDSDSDLSETEHSSKNKSKNRKHQRAFEQSTPKPTKFDKDKAAGMSATDLLETYRYLMGRKEKGTNSEARKYMECLQERLTTIEEKPRTIREPGEDGENKQLEEEIEKLREKTNRKNEQLKKHTEQINTLNEKKEALEKTLRGQEKKLREAVSKELETREEAEKMYNKLKEKEAQLEKLKQELEDSQNSFVELNAELAKLRNSRANTSEDHSHMRTEDSYEIEVIEEDKETELINSSSTHDYTEESEVEEYNQPQQPSEIKSTMKSLKELNNQRSFDEEEKRKYIRGYNLLKRDFMNHGRKVWNNKTVESFIKLLCNKKTEFNNMEEHKIPEQNNEEVIDLLALTNQLQKDHDDMKKALEHFRTKSTEENEILKESKLRHKPMEKIINDYLVPSKIIIERAEDNTKQLYEGLKDFHRINPKQLSDQITEKINNNLTHLLAEMKKIDEKKHHQLKDKSQQQQLNRSEKSKTREKEQREQLTKLVIIPIDKRQAPQVNHLIREEIKKPELRPAVKQLRKTLNQNIEIRAKEKDIEQIKKALKASESLQTCTQMVEPEQRQMKILLLRVPNDIKKEDIERELEHKNYFDRNEFEIIKNFPARRGEYNNWVLQSNSKMCRNLLRKGKINIYTEQIKLVNHIRVLRCTNCQALENHVASQCKWQAECANCAESHHTKDCTNTAKACVNCTRESCDGEGHSAYSTDCPQYQKEKREKLNSYYQGTQAQANYHINGEQISNHRNIVTDETESTRNHGYQLPPRRNTTENEVRTVAYREIKNSERKRERENRMIREARPPHCR